MKNKTLVVSISIALIFFLGLIFYINTHLPGFVRKYLQDYVRLNLNATSNLSKFEIESLYLRLPSSIVLGNVRLENEKFSLFSKSIVLNFNIIEGLFNRNLVNSLREVNLISPKLVIEDIGDLSYPQESEFKNISVSWRDGEASVSKLGIPRTRGKIVFSKKVNILDCMLDTKSGVFSVRFLADKKKDIWKMKVSGNINFPKINFEMNFSGNFPKEKYASGASGAMNLYLADEKGENSFTGRSTFTVNGFPLNLSFESTLKPLDMKVGGYSMSGEGNLLYSDNKLVLKDFIFSDTTTELKIDGYVGKEELVLNMALSEFSISKTLLPYEIFPITELPQNYHISTTLNYARDEMTIRGLIKPATGSPGSFSITGKRKEDDIIFYTKMFSGDKTKIFFNGNINAAFTEKSKLTGKFSFNKPDINASGEIIVSTEQVVVSGCRIEQIEKKGLLSFDGTYDLTTAKENLIVKLEFDNFYYNNNLRLKGALGLSGKVTRTKSISLKGSLSGNDLVLNDFKLKEIACNVLFEKDVLTLRDFKGDGIKSKKFVIDVKNDSIEGDVYVSDLKMKDIKFRGMEDLSFKESALNLGLSVSGKIPNPEIVFKYSISGLEYNTAKFNISGSGEYRREELGFKGDLSLKTGKKGVYQGKLTNKIVLRTGPKLSNIDLEVNFQKLDTNTIYNFIKKPSGLPQIDGELSTNIYLSAGLSNLSGKIDNPDIKVHFKSDKLYCQAGKFLPKGEWSYAELDARIEGGNTFIINNLEIRQGTGKISLLPQSKVKIINADSGEFDLNISLKNVKYVPLTLFGRSNISGEWTKDAIKGKVMTDNLWVNLYNFEKAKFIFTYKTVEGKKLLTLFSYPDESYEVTGQLDMSNPPKIKFSNISIKDDFIFKLNGNYDKEYSDLEIQGTNVNCDALFGIINLNVPLEGNSDFTVLFKGTLDKPFFSGSMNVSSGKFYGVPFSNANVQFNSQGNMLNIQSVRLVKLKNGKEQMVLIGNGRLPLPLTEEVKEKSLYEQIYFNLILSEGDLSILESMSDRIKSATGAVRTRVELSGTIDNPSFKGFLKIDGGTILSKQYINKLERLNVDIEFINNKIKVNEFTGKIGEGQFQLTGNVSLAKLFELNECDLTLKTVDEKGIKISVPELPIPSSPLLKRVISASSFGDPTFNLTLKGKKGNLKFAGYVQLDNTHFSYPPLEEAKKSPFIKDLSGNTKWDLEIRSGKNTWYENELINSSIDGALKFTDNLINLRINGKINALSGNINYLNKNYKIKEAVFEVINGDCFLSVSAETTVSFESKEESSVEMIIPRGPIGEIQPIFKSRDRPDMSSEELIRKTIGIDEKMSGEERDLLLKKQLVRLFDSSLTSPLARGMLQRSGLVDSLQVTYAEKPGDTTSQTVPSPAELLKGTKITVEKYLTEKLLFGYSVAYEDLLKLDLKYGQFEFAYRLEKNWFLRGTVGLGSKDALLYPERRITIERFRRFGWEEK